MLQRKTCLCCVGALGQASVMAICIAQLSYVCRSALSGLAACCKTTVNCILTCGCLH